MKSPIKGIEGPYSLIFFSLLPLIIVLYYPLLQGIWISLTYWSLLSNPVFVGVNNYIFVFSDLTIRKVFLQNIYFAAFSIPGAFLLGLGFALLLNRNFKGARIVRILLLIPYMAPSVVTGMTWRFLLHDQVGAINKILLSLNLIQSPIGWLTDINLAFICIIFARIWQFTPFVTLCLLSGLQAIPQDKIEAAQVDGASSFAIFTYIIIPFLRPIILLIFTLGFVDSFRVFDIIYVMTRGGPALSTQILPTYAYRLAFYSVDFGSACALSNVTLLIALILLLPVLKYLVGEKD
ncbi:MAG: sugar ABC transporter permease [Nitrososphaeria archaeon]